MQIPIKALLKRVFNTVNVNVELMFCSNQHIKFVSKLGCYQKAYFAVSLTYTSLSRFFYPRPVKPARGGHTSLGPTVRSHVGVSPKGVP